MSTRLEAGDRIRLNRLMAQVADGDRAAIQPVFATLWPKVLAWCVRLLDSREDGEDVAQQALVQLFRQASQFDKSRDALTWALTLAWWACRSHKRKIQRRLGVRLEDWSNTASPEALAIERDLVAALDELIQTLSPEDQALLKATCAQGQPRSAALRKRKERILAVLRKLWRIHHGDTR